MCRGAKGKKEKEKTDSQKEGLSKKANSYQRYTNKSEKTKTSRWEKTKRQNPRENVVFGGRKKRTRINGRPERTADTTSRTKPRRKL